MTRPFRFQQRGLTMAEIMLVLVLLALLLGATFIMGRSTTARRQIDQAANELKGGLQLARTTSVNAGGARLDLTMNGNVMTGWTLVDGTGNTVKRHEAPPRVVVNVTPSVNRIEFLSNGSLSDATVGGPSGTEVVLRVTNQGGDLQRTIRVNRTTGSVLLEEG